MIIAVDVDDTVAELVPAWLEIYNKTYKDNIKPEDIKSWDISSYCHKCSKSTFYGIINNQEFYNNVRATKGALDGVNRLRKMGHRVIFVTNAMNGHAGAKLRWLQEHYFLPEDDSAKKDYIETADKSLVNADLIIDDNMEYINAFYRNNKKAIVFTRPWNNISLTYMGTMRAENWEEVTNLLTEPIPTGAPMVIPATNYNAQNIYMPTNQLSITGDTKYSDATLSTTAVKYDQGKLEWDLLPFEVIKDIVWIFMYGKNKYKKDNWKLKFKFSKIFNATMRHLTDWQTGENNDIETGKSHLVHAATNLIFLAYYMAHYNIYKECDDRPTEENLRKFIDGNKVP
jgi:5'(3')-deoxyribonucleotidase